MQGGIKILIADLNSLPLDGRDIALAAAGAARDKKASDVVVIDVSKLTVVTDYLVICHGNSRVHVQAISEGIEEELEKQGVNCLRREGFEDGRWIVLDYGDAIVHVFRQEERLYYNLERLWSDAPTIEQG